MATKDTLLELYDSLTPDNLLGKNKQIEFIILLSKIIYLRQKGIIPKLESIDTQIDLQETHQHGINVRSVADKLNGLALLINSKTAEERRVMLTKKLVIVVDAYGKNDPAIPSIDEFKRALCIKEAPLKAAAAQPAAPVANSSSKSAAAVAGPEPHWKAECRKSEVVAASETAKNFVRNPARVRNLFPRTDLRTLHTLDALNAFIEENYRDRLGPEVDRTRSTRLLGSYMSTFSEYSFSDYQCMESAGSNSDCLIHSFLTATCPAFRRLTSGETETGYDKNEFATWFRQYVYPTLPSVATQIQDTTDDLYRPDGVTPLCLTTGEILKYRIFTRGEFLSDQDLGKLCMDYGIHTILFQGRDELEQQTMTFSGLDLTNPRARVYMIGNAAGVHYESVRTPDGSYTISGETALKINQIIRETFIYVGFNAMRDPVTIRRGATTYGIQLADGRTADQLKRNIRTTIAGAKRDMRRGAAAAAAPHPEAAAPNTPNVNSSNRDTYIALSLSHPAANNMRKAGLSDEELSEQYGQLWNTAKSRRNAARKKQEANNAAFARQLAAGVGGGRRKRTAKALRHRRSLRAKRNHSSKGKRHGSRRKR